MKRKLFNFFFKKSKSKTQEWLDTLTELVNSENIKDLKLPILLLDKNIKWEFKVFSSLEELLNDSIYSHWSGITPNDSKLEAIAVDCEGFLYEIENDCYNKKLEISYSYPRKLDSHISISDLKEKIVSGYKEYIEIFEPNFRNQIIDAIESIDKAKTINEVFILIKNIDS